mmetsp:Transcript_2642/g.8035  ORF Transcript_2642/g.8035 Transcript_2642/m.8035 type:complete len:232 (+) Transcript_2642:521-1216(+)
MNVRRGLQLDECLGTLHEVLVIVGGQGDDGVNGLRVKDILIIGEAESSLHRLLVLAFVELPLRDEVDVKGLATTPRTLKGPIACDALVLRDQGLHRLRSGHRAHRGAGHLHVQGLGLILFDFKGSQQVELLDTVRVLLRSAGHFTCDLRKQLGGLSVPVGFSVELHSLDLLILVEEVLRILCKQALDLLEVLLLRQIHSKVPLVKEHASVHCRLHVPMPQESLHCLLAQAY